MDASKLIVYVLLMVGLNNVNSHYNLAELFEPPDNLVSSRIINILHQDQDVIEENEDFVNFSPSESQFSGDSPSETISENIFKKLTPSNPEMLQRKYFLEFLTELAKYNTPQIDNTTCLTGTGKVKVRNSKYSFLK